MFLVYQEPNCVLAQGICKLQSDCPADLVENYAGLCSNQKDSQVVCCPKFAHQKCLNRAGECTRNCPPKARQEEYNHECETGEYCCLWLWSNLV